MNLDFRNLNLLYIYLFLYTILGWFSTYHKKEIIKNIHPFSLVILTNIISFTILWVLLLFKDYYSFKTFKNDVTKIKINDLIILLLISLIYLLGHIISSIFLQYHNVHVMRISKYFITIFVGAVAFYMFNDDIISMSKSLGFVLMSLGLLLFFEIINIK